MAKKRLDIIPGGTAGADLDASLVQNRSAWADTPASDTSHLSNNINWLSGSYAGADIKVVAHLYGKVVKDEETNDAKEQSRLNKSIADGAEALAAGADNNLVRELLSQGKTADQINAAINLSWSSLVPNEPDAAAVLYRRLYNPYRDYCRHNNPNFPALCMSLSQEYNALAQSIDDAIQQVNDQGSTTCVLENLQTISVQSYREKNAVRSLGKSYVSGYVRGPRTLGGSMIFTMIQEHPLKKLISAMDKAGLYGETQYDYRLSTLISDQLPPIDLTIVFANEYGAISRMGIYGVEFMTDGLTLSSEDIMTEVVCQFVARDIDVPTALGNRRLIQSGAIYGMDGQMLSGSSLMIGSKDEYNKFLDKVRMRNWFKGR